MAVKYLMTETTESTFKTQSQMDTAAIAAINAAGLSFAEAKAMNFVSILTSADHTYWGITRNIVAGEALSRGQVAYQKAADAEWWLAKGDAYVTCKGILVLCVADIADTATGIGLVLGCLRDDTWAFTTQNELWVSKATGGLVTDTQPTTPAFVRNIGHAENTDTAFFNGYNTTIVEI